MPRGFRAPFGGGRKKKSPSRTGALPRAAAYPVGAEEAFPTFSGSTGDDENTPIGELLGTLRTENSHSGGKRTRSVSRGRRLRSADNSSSSESSSRSSRRTGPRSRNELSQEESSVEENVGSEPDGEYTIKDRQDELNLSHPFGVRLWKPALYKKDRSINRQTTAAVHALPTDSPELYVYPSNVFYAVVFGWWLSMATFLIAAILGIIPTEEGKMYASLLRGLAGYILWPFGKYVETTSIGGEEDTLEAGTAAHGENDVHEPLLGPAPGIGPAHHASPRCAGLAFAGCVYHIFFYVLLAPLYLFVCACCWFMVFTLPMAKLTGTLVSHLHESPLSIRFKRGSGTASPGSTVLLCTYHAVSWKCYKYTIDGTNILFINLMGVVFFVLVDNYLLKVWWGSNTFITHYITIFALCLASTIPLAYFIGQGVAAISAQSSLGMGAVINATFGSIVEVILYCMALRQGKGVLVEGSIIGSFLGSLLLMPGLSMVAGGINVKQQRFNARSAGVTSTMLIFSLIGVCTPSLFYSNYGRFEMKCSGCPPAAALAAAEQGSLCSRCSYEYINPLTDEFFQRKVEPLMYLCALLLPLAYLIGLWFTLRTHVSHIYSDPPGNSLPSHHIRPDSVYKRLISVGSVPNSKSGTMTPNTAAGSAAAIASRLSMINFRSGPSGAYIAHPTVCGPDQITPSRSPLELVVVADGNIAPPPLTPASTMSHAHPLPDAVHRRSQSGEGGGGGGHDAPNWSKLKAAIVLCVCTVLFSAIAEILVDSVDPVVEKMKIDEKLLGLTLFALVPNVTEFMNAISFAIYNNIALSMEIGSAYAVQVALLQIPSLVAYSGFTRTEATDYRHMFTLIFARWDVITLIFAVFLLTYVYIEGKSNYFKGSMLVSAYAVLIISFFFAPPAYVRGDHQPKSH